MLSIGHYGVPTGCKSLTVNIKQCGTIIVYYPHIYQPGNPHWEAIKKFTEALFSNLDAVEGVSRIKEQFKIAVQCLRKIPPPSGAIVEPLFEGATLDGNQDGLYPVQPPRWMGAPYLDLPLCLDLTPQMLSFTFLQVPVKIIITPAEHVNPSVVLLQESLPFLGIFPPTNPDYPYSGYTDLNVDHIFEFNQDLKLNKAGWLKLSPVQRSNAVMHLKRTQGNGYSCLDQNKRRYVCHVCFYKCDGILDPCKWFGIHNKVNHITILRDLKLVS